MVARLAFLAVILNCDAMFTGESHGATAETAILASANEGIRQSAQAAGEVD